MKKYSYFLMYLLLLQSIHLWSYSVVITIDDYPLTNGPLLTLEERTQNFIAAAREYNCSIAFFCVGKYYQQRGNKSLVESLTSHGHYIANHSMNHSASSSLTREEFEKEVKDAEYILNLNGSYRKWFRYPYLDYGNQTKRGGSLEKNRKFRSFLADAGYVDGYSTIDSFDWYIQNKINKAVKENKPIDYEKLKNFFVSLVEEVMQFSFVLYENVLQQDIVHSLLFHDNDLTALYLQDILAMINRNGWNIVSPEQAFISPAWRDRVSLVFKKPVHFVNFIEVGQRFKAAGIVRE